MMWEAAAAQDRASMGGRVLMDRKVDGLHLRRRAAASGRSRHAAPTARRETYTARHVVSSAPIRELIARDQADADLAVCTRRALKYRDFLTVVLIGRSHGPLPDNWVYIHDPSRAGRPRAEFPLLVAGDGPGRRLDLPGARVFLLRGRRPLDAPDEELVALAKRRDRPIGLMRPETMSSTPASCASPRPIRSTTTTTRHMST